MIFYGVYSFKKGTMDRKKGKAKELQVQGTNDHATLSKFSTVKQGYYQDKFLRYFVSKVVRRAPIIHWSYYTRAKAIHFMVKRFLMSGSFGSLQKQILSFGAGFDTLFFNLHDEGLLNKTTYYEVDFPEVVKHKASLISQHQELSDAVGMVSTKPDWLGEGLLSKKYKLFGCNLKNLSALEEGLLACGMDRSLPTLLLCEVVLTYIDPPQSSTVLIGWSARFFTSAVFVMNEQVSPNDPFGIKMINHFRFSVGAPLHGTEAYPSRQSQVLRFKKEGWTVVDCPTLNFVYYDTLPVEEKARLETLEPFDEFEEWHLMCSHYIVLVAFKGSCQNLRENLLKIEKDTFLEREPQDYPSFEIYSENISSSPDSLMRFGHTATPFPGGGILLIGGFGVENGKHTRLRGAQFLQRDQGAWHCTELTSDSAETTLDSARIFHSATAFSDESVIIYGGRTSPTKPCLETVKITLMDGSDFESSCVNPAVSPLGSINKPEGIQRSRKTKYRQSCLVCSGEIPSPRWRHSATRVVFSDGRESLLIFGGRTPSCLALGDCYLLDVKSNTWSKVHLNGDTVEPRHSHTACIWKEKVVLAGGLGSNLHALNTVQLIDTSVTPMTLQTLPVDPPLQPRYSHTAHVINDNLILVGGVTPNSSQTPGVVLLHLNSLEWKSFYLPAITSPLRPFMVHNHSSISFSESREIMVIGGGGNCFSFGTHLNDGLVLIKIPAVDSGEDTNL